MQLLTHTATAPKVQNAKRWSECGLVILSMCANGCGCIIFSWYTFFGGIYLKIQNTQQYPPNKMIGFCRFLAMLTLLSHIPVPKHTPVL